MKKIILIILLVLLSFTSGCINKPKIKNSKTYKVFTSSVTNADTEVKLTEFTTYKDIYYIDVVSAMDLLDVCYKNNRNSNFYVRTKKESNKYTFTKVNDSSVTFDANNDTIIFNEYDLFIKPSYAYCGEFVDSYSKISNTKEGNINLIGRTDTISYYQNNPITVIDLAKFDIHYCVYDDLVFIPFQTFSDIFLSPIYCSLTKMGNNIYTSSLMNSTIKYQDTFKADTFTVSEDLLVYTYNEFLLYLYYFCGTYNSNRDDLINYVKDIANMDKATLSVSNYDYFLSNVLINIIRDGHSDFTSYSPMNEDKRIVQPNSFIDTLYNKRYDIFQQISNYNGSTFKSYEEIDNTAYITFDAFTDLKDDYTIPSNLSEVSGNANKLMIYAYNQITRNESPIENVVIDLSLNGGGESNSLVYILGFILDKVNICTKNSVSNNVYISTYESDTNLDHVIDEKDKLLLDKNIYIISSNASYSAAHDFIALAKGNNNITIIGEKSSGGATNSLYNINSIGTSYKISGNVIMLKNDLNNIKSLEEEKNVDVELTYAQLYDRISLTDYINSVR